MQDGFVIQDVSFQGSANDNIACDVMKFFGQIQLGEETCLGLSQQCNSCKRV